MLRPRRIQTLLFLLIRVLVGWALQPPHAQDIVVSADGLLHPNTLHAASSPFQAHDNRLRESVVGASGAGDVMSDPIGLPEDLFGMFGAAEEMQWPAPSYDASSQLPCTSKKQGGDIAASAWPEKFCINVTLVPPDKNRPDYPNGQHYEAIALVGGGTPYADVCGNLMLFIMHNNTVGMGVQKSQDNSDCDTNAQLNDDPIATTTQLEGGGQSHVAFCYDVPLHMVYILIDDKIAAVGQKNFTFPREGKVTFLDGSHNMDVDVMVLTDSQLLSLSVSEMPDSVKTQQSPEAQAGSAVNASSGDANGTASASPVKFWMTGGPKTELAQAVQVINETQWPSEFCISVNISTPPVRKRNISVIAALGGEGRCGSLVIFFADNNVVGMGINPECNTGSSPPLLSTEAVPDGTNWLSFCYSKYQRRASIIRNGNQVLQVGDNWDFFYDRYGSVTYLGGSHVPAENQYELLESVKLWSLEIIQCDPQTMPPNHSLAPQSEIVTNANVSEQNRSKDPIIRDAEAIIKTRTAEVNKRNGASGAGSVDAGAGAAVETTTAGASFGSSSLAMTAPATTTGAIGSSSVAATVTAAGSVAATMTTTTSATVGVGAGSVVETTAEIATTAGEATTTVAAGSVVETTTETTTMAGEATTTVPANGQNTSNSSDSNTTEAPLLDSIFR